MKKIPFALLALLLFACGAPAPENNTEEQPEEVVVEQVVNVYTHRHYEADEQLFELFTKQTGIEVNIVKASADELMVRMENEGADCPADVLITVDAGRLVRAKDKGLFQPISSKELEANIPANLRDAEGHWFGQTMRARLLVYSKERVKPEELNSYADLTYGKWKGRILVRSGENMYNRSLLASMIAHYGEDDARNWAAGIVANMARDPKGGDRDQIKAIAAGQGDVAIVNSYYLGGMLSSEDADERAAGEAVQVFFPDQDGVGTHINVSGAGVAKYAPHKENAIKLLEFFAGADAQRIFAEANQEYPVRPGVEASAILRNWGTFKMDSLPVQALGGHNEQAAMLFDQAGWK